MLTNIDKQIYKNEDVIASIGGYPDSAYNHETEYSGASCKCGYNLYIKTPFYKGWYSIECPECKHVVRLYCGSVEGYINEDLPII